jgi:iron complex outermembrane receptor protein
VTTVTGQTVTTAGVDVDNPTALPLIRTIVASYTNADSEVASGVDLTGTARYDLGHGLRFTSSFNGAWLTKLALTSNGVEYRYDGSLGACGTTSCSGAPHFRANWSNTLEINRKYSVTLTGNYTSGYSEVATDAAASTTTALPAPTSSPTTAVRPWFAACIRPSRSTCTRRPRSTTTS